MGKRILTTPQESSDLRAPRRVIAWRLAVGFGLVSLVAVAMFTMLLLLIADVSALIGDMRDYETTIQVSQTFSKTTREQYIHLAQWIVSRDAIHLAHYQEVLESTRASIDQLESLLTSEQRWRVDRIVALSAKADSVFRYVLKPAIEQNDVATSTASHLRLQALSLQASTQSDEIAKLAENQMVTTHIAANNATRLGLVTGGVCVLLVLLLSVVYTTRLRNAVLTPLNQLSRAAARFGRGDLHARVGPVGEGEILAVAQAFDQMVEELERREKRLVEAERMAAIGQLAAGIAHEINNPIAVIRGYLKTMDPNAPSETLQTELEILDEEAASCQRIADDLLAYSRGHDLILRPIDAGRLLSKTARRFAETKDAANKIVECEAQPGSIVADDGRLRQVILNLLRNAAQVSPDGGTIQVNGTCAANGGYDVTITDEGPGISAGDRLKIFEPFFSKRPGGSGLGLAVCHGIIQAHGGSIGLENLPGGGASVRFHIPQQQVPEREVTGEEAHAKR